jgi:hypothetical protein
MASEAELVIGLVEVSETGYQFAFVIALEAGSGYYVEDREGAVATPLSEPK